MLGKLCGQSGELDRAFPHLQQAVALAPDFVGAHIALGNVHKLRGEAAAAAASYRTALALDPDCAPAFHNLGLLLKLQGRQEEALSHLKRAYELAPDLGDALKEWSLSLVQLGRFEEALEVLNEVLAGQPGFVQALICRGFVYQKMHHPQAALSSYEAALQLETGDAELFNNLAIVLQDLGRLDEALAHYDKAIALQADPKLRQLPVFHRALARLLKGDWTAWDDYEARLESEDSPPRPESYPRWYGGDLAGRTILVYGEQGLGDELMFASCLPQVIAAAGHCVIECSPKLHGIFSRSFPTATVYAATPGRQVPPENRAGGIDCESPAGSLPRHLRRSAAAFPQHPGYLRAAPERIAYWRERLAALGPGLKVGISWQGGTHQTRSPLRSIPLPQWLPILNAAQAHFGSLQYGDCHDALGELAARHGMHVTHWQEAIDDYDETAALLCALDLVISVCTAVVHLGGALGRPVWIMAPYCPEWRYGFAGKGMPWYPSVRVFRQPSFGEWSPVIERVAAELKRAVRSGRSPS